MLARAPLLEAPAQSLRRLWPGLATCVCIALAASYLAAQHQGPPMLYALLLGIALNHQGQQDRNSAGVDFCSSAMLRLGVGLLGARISWAQVGSLGWPVMLLVVAAVGSTLLFAWWLGRLMRLPWQLAVLAGGATAICGATAALAIAAVLPRPREGETAPERHALIIVVMATLLSTAAMVAFPLMARGLHLSPASAGLFIGGSIHDVAQVVVAGYSISAATGDMALIVKLLRVSLLVVVVLGVSIACGGPQAGPTRTPWSTLPRLHGTVPGFLWLFIALATLNSAGWLGPLPDYLNVASRMCLLLGAAGLGVKTSFPHLARAGWRPALLMLATSAWLASAMLGAAWR